MEKKHILIICFTELKSDPRIYKQILFLKDKYKISTLGLSDPEIEGVDFFKINEEKTSGVLKKLIRFSKIKISAPLKYYWSTIKNLNEIKKFYNNTIDLIIANEYKSLPLAFSLKQEKTKIIFDAHEYYPKQFEDDLKWRLAFKTYMTKICRQFIPQCDGYTTVSEEMAKIYKDNFSIESTIINNAPEFVNQSFSDVNNNQIKMVYHGVATPSRKIHLLIEMMEFMNENFYLDLIIITKNSSFLNKLKELAKNNNRIRFLAPLPMPLISKETNHYDIGVHTLMPVNLNHQITIPNKFFEYVQARLALATPSGTEMAKMVKKYNCGIVIENFNPKNAAAQINKLDKNKILEFKKSSNKIAYTLSAESNKEKLNELVSQLV